MECMVQTPFFPGTTNKLWLTVFTVWYWQGCANQGHMEAQENEQDS